MRDCSVAVCSRHRFILFLFQSRFFFALRINSHICLAYVEGVGRFAYTINLHTRKYVPRFVCMTYE